MIKVKHFVFNPFHENTYLLYDKTGSCIIVDPGCQSDEERGEITGFIEEKGLKPSKIVNTHCHVDHLLGNAFLNEKYDLEAAAHGDDLFLLENAAEHALMFGFELEKPPLPQLILKDNDQLSAGDSKLKVLHVPGHSPGSIALYSEEQKFVLTGDLIFAGGIGRTDLPGGDYNTLIRSVKEKILTLPEDVRIFPGHGGETTVGREKAQNPFLM